MSKRRLTRLPLFQAMTTDELSNTSAEPCPQSEWHSKAKPQATSRPSSATELVPPMADLSIGIDDLLMMHYEGMTAQIDFDEPL